MRLESKLQRAITRGVEWLGNILKKSIRGIQTDQMLKSNKKARQEMGTNTSRNDVIIKLNSRKLNCTQNVGCMPKFFFFFFFCQIRRKRTKQGNVISCGRSSETKWSWVERRTENRFHPELLLICSQSSFCYCCRHSHSESLLAPLNLCRISDAAYVNTCFLSPFILHFCQIDYT
jgi:hypothetical protein